MDGATRSRRSGAPAQLRQRHGGTRGAVSARRCRDRVPPPQLGRVAIVAATECQFTDEERDIEARQPEVDTAQAPLDRHRPNSTG